MRTRHRYRKTAKKNRNTKSKSKSRRYRNRQRRGGMKTAKTTRSERVKRTPYTRDDDSRTQLSRQSAFLPTCAHGMNCYRKNPEHFKQELHPRDHPRAFAIKYVHIRDLHKYPNARINPDTGREFETGEFLTNKFIELWKSGNSNEYGDLVQLVIDNYRNNNIDFFIYLDENIEYFDREKLEGLQQALTTLQEEAVPYSMEPLYYVTQNLRA